MRRILALALLILSSPGMVSAKPNLWKRIMHSKWEGVIVIGAVVVATMADAYQTDRALRRCAGCVERSVLLGHHPSTKRIYLTHTALAAGYGTGLFFLRRYERNDADGFHLIPAAGLAIAHGLAARSNTKIRGDRPNAAKD